MKLQWKGQSGKQSHRWKEENELVKLRKLIKVAETRLLCLRPSNMLVFRLRLQQCGTSSPAVLALFPLCQSQSEPIKAASHLVASRKTFRHSRSATRSIKQPQGIIFISFPSQLHVAISMCSWGSPVAAGGWWSCGPTPSGCLFSSSSSVWEIREPSVSGVSHSPFNVSRNLSSLKFTLAASRRTPLIPTFSHTDSVSSHIGAQSDLCEVMWSFIKRKEKEKEIFKSESVFACSRFASTFLKLDVTTITDPSRIQFSST